MKQYLNVVTAYMIMFTLIILVGIFQSWSQALSILNYCLISAVMTIGANIQWGYAGLIDNMIKLIKRQTKVNFKVVLTGGLANLYKNSINTKCKVDKDLTIKGIVKITKYLI